MFGLNFVKYIVIAIRIMYTHNENWGITQENDKISHKQQFFSPVIQP